MPTQPTATLPLGFTLGADPEFLLTLADNPLNAGRVLPLLKNQSMSGMGFPTDGGELGVDGCPTTGEMRPNPAATPAELTDNLRHIIKNLADASQGAVGATCQSVHAPVGGHIHLAIPRELADSNRRLNEIVKRTLCAYAPLVAGESKETKAVRGPSCSYGYLHDYKTGEHDGTYTVELRAPSAEWLTTPKIAEATIAYIAMCWYEALNRPRSYSKRLAGMVPKSLHDVDTLQQLAESAPRLFDKYITTVRCAVRHFALYPQYKEQIDYILDAKQVLKDKQAVDFDMLKGWGFAPAQVRPATVKDALDLASKPSPALDRLLTSQSLPSRLVPSLTRSDDDNTDLYAHALTKSVLSAGIAPKTLKPVRLFGLAASRGNALQVFKGNGSHAPATCITATLADAPTISLPADAYAIGIPYAWRTDATTPNTLPVLLAYLRLQYGELDASAQNADASNT